MKNHWKKTAETQIDIPHLQPTMFTTQLELFMSDWKKCRHVFDSQQIKNCLSSIYQTISTAVFATILFMTKITCHCVMDEWMSTISHLTKESSANPLSLFMYYKLTFYRSVDNQPLKNTTVLTFLIQLILANEIAWLQIIGKPLAGVIQIGRELI